MEVNDFGGCPMCGKNDGYVNAGRTSCVLLPRAPRLMDLWR